MKENVKKIQVGLSGIVGSDKFNLIRQYAHILIFLSPAHSLLQSFFNNYFIRAVFAWTAPLCYIASLIGFLICFAKNDMKKIGIYFVLRGVQHFFGLLAINFIGMYSVFINFLYIIGSLIYVAFYVFLALKAFKLNDGSSYVATSATVPNVAPTANIPNENKCSKCGSVLKTDASFCSVCGTKVE